MLSSSCEALPIGKEVHNGNINGLIRQCIPMDQNFLAVTEGDLIWIMKYLSFSPRKCLDYQSPIKVFFEQTVAFMSRIQGIIAYPSSFL